MSRASRARAASAPALRFADPAGRWTEALPLGNGNLGAMVHGGVRRELVQLNDDTFWSGHPRQDDRPQAREAVAAARRLVLDGDPIAAEGALKAAQGPFTESFLPLADLILDLAHADEEVTGYERVLDLETGIASTIYTTGGVEFSRQAFTSVKTGALTIRLDADRASALAFDARVSSPWSSSPSRILGARIVAVLKAPDHVVPSYLTSLQPIIFDHRTGHGMAASVVVDVETDGTCAPCPSGRLRVTGASWAVITLATATGFRTYDRMPDKTPGECVREATRRAAAAAAAGFDHVRREHVKEHRATFSRVDIDLGSAARDATRVTPDLIRSSRSDGKAAVALAELLFHFGRYLLMAASRPGTQAANLQGIWNRDVRPPWSSNYTLNINTQMNYWLAGPTGLSDMNIPLLDLVSGLAETGTATARGNYGLPGWVAHHNSDVWCASTAVGAGSFPAVWSSWWMGGAWLATHVWEHFLHTRDAARLRRDYPALKGAAEFVLAWLVEDDRGELVTAPATSPENSYRTADGAAAAVTWAPTMDLALTSQLFVVTARACEVLEVDADFAARLRSAERRLRRPRIGSRRELHEWAEDVVDVDPHHRHVSHLVGIFPGDVHADDDQLQAAARVSLNHRGDESTGWSRAWKANLWARLGDGDRAWQLLQGFCTELTTEEVREDGGIYANLFCAHPPFQIDGNFGFTSAVCLMIVDSREDAIHLLPALPAAVPEGAVRGLHTRAGVIVDITWSGGVLVHAHLTSVGPRRLVDVRWHDLVVGVDVGPEASVRIGPESFRTS